MKVLLTAVLTVAALSSGSVVKAPGDTFELLILHNNDMHARFEQTSQLSGTCTTADREAGKCYGGFPRVAHVVKEARKAAQSGEGPPVLYLNAGDTYTGTAWFTIYKWKIAAEFVNALQPDAVSLGNHDFDIGVSGLTPFIRNLTCPVLACNLILTDEPELQAETNLMKSFVFDIDGIQVGVIGYLTPDTKFEAIGNKIDYIEEITAIRQETAVLKNKGVQILIALGHSGFLKDLEIAKEVEDIDLVIGAHTHTFLQNGERLDIEDPVGPYPTIVKQESGRLVPVVQAYAYTKYLGKLHLTFNSDGEIMSYNGNPILLDVTIPQDSQVLKIINHYHDKVLKITQQVIGNTLVFINGHTCRVKECNMGNLITDAMVYKYASTYRGHGWTDAPIAVVQSGGIRSSFKDKDLPSNITKGDLWQVLPFDGVVGKVAISGDAILRMLEHSVHEYNPLYPTGQLLQMSGMRVKYDLTQPPKKRVTKVSLRCGNCLYPEYFALNKTEEYNILMPVFLANGGDGFFTLDDLPVTDINLDQIQCTEAYLKSHSPVYPGVEGRILFHKTTQDMAEI